MLSLANLARSRSSLSNKHRGSSTRSLPIARPHYIPLQHLNYSTLSPSDLFHLQNNKKFPASRITSTTNNNNTNNVSNITTNNAHLQQQQQHYHTSAPTSASAPKAVPLSQLAGDSFLNGTSASYEEQMFEAWKNNPQSVHASWNAFFSNIERGVPPHQAFQPPPNLIPGYKPSSSTEGTRNHSFGIDWMNTRAIQLLKQITFLH